MPIYHLNLRNAHLEADDAEGHELPDLDRARAMAIDGIRGFLSDEVRGGKCDLRGRIDITNGSDQIISVVEFSEAVEVIAP